MTQSKPHPLVAEVISIGDEMTSGARVDTNSAWISRRLGELGVTVKFHSTVADTLEDNIAVFRIATERADVVVTTGGLGPTRDDLTREVLAALVGRPLQLQDSAMQHIESLFAKRSREMPERNRVQAMFPVGSQQIFNPQGTAPGIEIVVARESGQPDSCIYALPGVPAEMKLMFDQCVAKSVLTRTGGATCIRHLVMKFFGTGESDMEQRLGEMISRDRQPRVGITVSGATISLRITATGQTNQTCDEMIRQTRQEILQRVPEFYFGDGEDFEQHHAIDATLRLRNQSLVVVELGRAAPLGDWFAALGETSAYRGGLSLATDKDLLAVFNGDKNQVLDQVKQRFAAQWLLMVDAYPRLDGEPEQPLRAAEVRLIVIGPDGSPRTKEIKIGGHPDILQARIAKSAMAWLRKQL